MNLADLASSLTLGLHLATLHVAGHGLEPVNPGLYVLTDSGFVAGFYRNSHRRLSTYAGWAWQTTDRRFAIALGAVTGYSAARIAPLVVPSVRLGLNDGIDARFCFIPRTPKGGTAPGLHFSLEHHF